MRFNLWLLIFGGIAVIVEAVIEEIVKEKLTHRTSLDQAGALSCDLYSLVEDEDEIECEAYNNTKAQHGTLCAHLVPNYDTVAVSRCFNGHWINTGTLSDVTIGHRSKRFLGKIVKGVFKTVGHVVSGIGRAAVCVLSFFSRCGGGGTVYVVKKAPKYDYCPESGEKHYAPEGQRDKTVSWTVPRASDSDGEIVSNSQKTTPLRGEKFQGSVYGQQHTVNYEAKDNDGMSAFCTFSFTVYVRFCPEIPRISHGYKVYNKNNIYGSMCSFYCDEGYERSGDSSAKCQQDGTWSGTASCSKKRCDKPDEPTHGAISCQNPQYEYLSICQVSCDRGFKLEGTVVMQCQADQTWSVVEAPRCVDVEPPTIECLTPQIFYADKGMLTASSVVWEEPTAYDTVDNNPVIVQTGGPQQNTTLSDETTYVSYVATDEAGNESPECSIELRVEPITCGHPADTLIDTKLIFNCSDSLYHYGVTCSLTCDLNFPLNGTDTIECTTDPLDDDPVGQWDWGPGEKPVCRVITCPPLDAPINGGYIEDSLDARPEIIMFCNGVYDIPEWEGFYGSLQCYDSLDWRPFSKLPDCIELNSGRIMNLPSELYYYSGECSDPDTLEQIRQQFLTIITTATKTRFHSLCTPDLLNCSLDSVKITCGPISRRKRGVQTDIQVQIAKLEETESIRRKREPHDNIDNQHHINKREETHATIITFDIVTEYDLSNLGNMTRPQRYEYIDAFQLQQKSVIEDLLANGALEIESLGVLREDSFQTLQYGSETCTHGMIFSRDRTCKPCPKGRFYDGDEKCTECPIGQYRDTDRSLECKDCPQGMTTEKNGSVSLDNCTEICSPGSYSKKGLAPCSLCPVGTYQNTYGMTRCDTCPSGQTTAMQGSTSQAACQGFDALLRTTSDDVSLGSIPAVENMSIVFWAKLFSAETMSMTSLMLKNESGADVMSINIAPEIAVQASDNLLQAAAILSDMRWDHVAVVWNSDISSLQVFVNGKIKDGQTVSLPTLTNGSIAVHSTASDGVYLTGLLAVDKVLKKEDIQPLLASCTETMDDNILSMDSFLGKSSHSIKIITPAICDAIDECTTAPCGDHLCVNEIGNFSCICSQGMTGRLCDIPVDYCINNECKNAATCSNQANGYICTCPEGFSGAFCEIAPVNGNWSEYGEWSSCTVSCEQGTRTRNRTCNNPPPGVGGQPCIGPELDTEECDLGECKECSATPPRCYGIFPNCSKDPATGIIQCFPYCRNGTFMQPGQNKYENYTCGPETDFEWTPFDWCPKCVDSDHVNRPGKYRLDTTLNYETQVPSSAVTDIKTKIEDELSARTDCATKGLCEVAISLDNSGSRKKRDTGSVLQITFDVVPGINGELNIDEYIDTGTLSDGLQELVDAIVSLELTAADLLANASSYFNVESGGVTYTIDGTSLTLNGIIDCPAGSVSDDGVCVACPIGTKAESNSCLYCDVGSYQDETGQTDCKVCPRGFSTSIIGASEMSECTVSVTVSATSRPTSVITTESVDSNQQSDDSDENEKGEDRENAAPSKTGIIVGIAIGSFAVVLAAIAIILICYYKHARRNRRQGQRGSFASLNMVGQGRPVSNSGHTPITAVNPLPPVFPTRAGADALMKEKDFQELDNLTAPYTALPPQATCFSPPPPYTENA